jgi:hypothetical protein
MSEIDTSPEALRALAEEVGDNSDNCTRRCGANEKCICNTVFITLHAFAKRATPAPARKFALGDYVTKLKGSSWTGHVVGFYSTALTPVGYAVESENEPGSVQIYPEAALRGVGEPVAPLDALAAPASAGDLVETVARAIYDSDMHDEGREAATAALTAIHAAGREIVDAGTVERLTRERDDLAKANADYKANWLEIKRERDEARADQRQSAQMAEAAMQTLATAEADAARLREALHQLVRAVGSSEDCSDVVYERAAEGKKLLKYLTTREGTDAGPNSQGG